MFRRNVKMKKIMALVISSAIVLGGKGVAGAKGDYNVNRISGKIDMKHQ